jgi:competence ComEA-like helix-hairpin-helix protein
MLNLTSEEKRVVLFFLGLAFCGLALNCLIKVNVGVKRIVYPQVQLAKINLNEISLYELFKIKGISKKLAAQIIEYRNLHSEFSNLKELKEIKGIGEQRYEKLKEIFFVK